LSIWVIIQGGRGGLGVNSEGVGRGGLIGLTGDMLINRRLARKRHGGEREDRNVFHLCRQGLTRILRGETRQKGEE